MSKEQDTFMLDQPDEEWVGFTPETANVRKTYATASKELFLLADGEGEAEFDRWLEAHDNIVSAIARAGR